MTLLTDQFYEDLPNEAMHWAAFAINLNPELTLNFLYKKAWTLAKTKNDIPHLGNIFLEVLFEDFKKCFEIKYPKETVIFIIDGLFSEVHINGFSLEDEYSFNTALLLYSNEDL